MQNSLRAECVLNKIKTHRQGGALTHTYIRTPEPNCICQFVCCLHLNAVNDADAALPAATAATATDVGVRLESVIDFGITVRRFRCRHRRRRRRRRRSECAARVTRILMRAHAHTLTRKGTLTRKMLHWENLELEPLKNFILFEVGAHI